MLRQISNTISYFQLSTEENVMTLIHDDIIDAFKYVQANTRSRMHILEISIEQE